MYICIYVTAVKEEFMKMGRIWRWHEVECGKSWGAEERVEMMQTQNSGVKFSKYNK